VSGIILDKQTILRSQTPAAPEIELSLEGLARLDSSKPRARAEWSEGPKIGVARIRRNGVLPADYDNAILPIRAVSATHDSTFIPTRHAQQIA